jgi:hypothetical protein
MKSPAWGAAHRIARDLDKGLETASKAERDQWKADDKDGRAVGAIPPARKLVVQDTTTEAIAAILVDNPNGLLVSIDELTVWFDLFTRYRKGGGSDANRWLGMWEGRRLKVARRMSGELYVPSALVSVVGTIQPGVLARIIRDEYRESGFLARLLLAQPPERRKSGRAGGCPRGSKGRPAGPRWLHGSLESRSRAPGWGPAGAGRLCGLGVYYNLTGDLEWDTRRRGRTGRRWRRGRGWRCGSP